MEFSIRIPVPFWLGRCQFSPVVRSDDRLADVDQNLGVVAMAQIQGQRFEVNGIFDLVDQFLVEFGSKPLPAHCPHEELTDLLEKVRCWLNGWRYDLDGWLVRARRPSDPARLPCDVGFVEESAVAVRTPADARRIDHLASLTQEPTDAQ